MDEELTVKSLKMWIENEAEFPGRTDDQFLLMFLRFCKFDISLTKAKLTLYYQNRIKYPQWWDNRDMNDPKLRRILDLKSMIIVTHKNPNLPAVGMAKLSRASSDSSIFNDLGKIASMGIEIFARHPSCQTNELILIMDCQNYPFWLAFKLLCPSIIKGVIESFFYAIPINLKKLIIINTPAIAIVRLALPLFGDLKHKVYVFGSDLSKLGECVALEALPEDYGGQARTFDQYHDAFVNALLEINKYLVDDEKYGSLPG